MPFRQDAFHLARLDDTAQRFIELPGEHSVVLLHCDAIKAFGEGLAHELEVREFLLAMLDVIIGYDIVERDRRIDEDGVDSFLHEVVEESFLIFVVGNENALCLEQMKSRGILDRADREILFFAIIERQESRVIAARDELQLEDVVRPGEANVVDQILR